MATKRQGLYQVDKQLNQAVVAIQADTGASPLMIGAVEKFRERLNKAIRAMECADDNLFDSVIELEQAATETKYALDANKSLAGETRREVLAAYMWVAGLRCCSGMDNHCGTLLQTGYSKELIESCKFDLESNYPSSPREEKG
jgi:hypothetical protein